METKPLILIVDDVSENIHILMNLLKDEFSIQVATNGKKAIELANKDPKPDLILLDIIMPEMDGYEVCKRIKASNKTKNIPIIFVTTLSEVENEAKGLALGAVDYISKPIVPELVKQRVKNHIELKQYRDNLEELVKEKTKEIVSTKEAIIEAMGIVAEKRDQETGEHIKRTKEFVKLLAKELAKDESYSESLNSEYIEYLYHAAPLHDIGKVAISDSILLKSDKLNSSEYEQMKQHTLIGDETLESVQEYISADPSLEMAKKIAMFHHENWDGSGYPQGLKGEEIPLCGRIMALADVYDALANKRVYKNAMAHEDVVKEIVKEKGKKFDPKIVEVFLKLEKEFYKILQTYSNK